MKWLKERNKNNKGFTLVELVIVIAILAILVGLLAPQYTKYVEKSRKAADASNMDEMVKVVKVLAADPASELPVATYTITISTDGTTTEVTSADDKTVDGKQLGVEAIKNALKDSIPNWNNTKTKSQKWNDGKAASIKADIAVSEDGGTKVDYSVVGFKATDTTTKDPFANYMANGTDGIK